MQSRSFARPHSRYVLAGWRVLLLCLLTIPFSVASIPVPAAAYNLEGCKWSSATITYYDNSGNYTSQTTGAANLWTITPTPLYYKRIYSYANVEVIAGYYGNPGWDGLTSYSCSGGYFTGETDSYYNTYYTDGYDSNGKEQVMVHELGHALGLAHNNPPLCNVPIMYYSSARYFTCSKVGPQQDDVNGVLAIY